MKHVKHIKIQNKDCIGEYISKHLYLTSSILVNILNSFISLSKAFCNMRLLEFVEIVKG